VIPAKTFAGIDTLVIVCCHAIFHPDPADPSFPLRSPSDEKNWHLADFQKGNTESGKPGEHETFLAHISAGIDALTTGSCAGRSVLIFSGGATKPSLTPITEARSYYHAALSHALIRDQPGGGYVKVLFDKGLIQLEEHATDSFQNLLFSIVLFRQATGCYPKNIRVITHAFKSRRFLELHAPTIHWPHNQIRVQGIDPVMSQFDHTDTVRGEELFGYGAWKDDPLGTGELLSKKRKKRGWQANTAKGLGSGLEESVQMLLDGTVVEDLPWAVPVRESPLASPYPITSTVP
jgi:hypothetical protein